MSQRGKSFNSLTLAQAALSALFIGSRVSDILLKLLFKRITHRKLGNKQARDLDIMLELQPEGKIQEIEDRMIDLIDARDGETPPTQEEIDSIYNLEEIPEDLRLRLAAFVPEVLTNWHRSRRVRRVPEEEKIPPRLGPDRDPQEADQVIRALIRLLIENNQILDTSGIPISFRDFKRRTHPNRWEGMIFNAMVNGTYTGPRDDLRLDFIDTMLIPNMPQHEGTPAEIALQLYKEGSRWLEEMFIPELTEVVNLAAEDKQIKIGKKSQLKEEKGVTLHRAMATRRRDFRQNSIRVMGDFRTSQQELEQIIEQMPEIPEADEIEQPVNLEDLDFSIDIKEDPKDVWDFLSAPQQTAVVAYLVRFILGVSQSVGGIPGMEAVSAFGNLYNLLFTRRANPLPASARSAIYTILNRMTGIQEAQLQQFFENNGVVEGGFFGSFAPQLVNLRPALQIIATSSASPRYRNMARLILNVLIVGQRRTVASLIPLAAVVGRSVASEILVAGENIGSIIRMRSENLMRRAPQSPELPPPELEPELPDWEMNQEVEAKIQDIIQAIGEPQEEPLKEVILDIEEEEPPVAAVAAVAAQAALPAPQAAPQAAPAAPAAPALLPGGLNAAAGVALGAMFVESFGSKIMEFLYSTRAEGPPAIGAPSAEDPPAKAAVEAISTPEAQEPDLRPKFMIPGADLVKVEPTIAFRDYDPFVSELDKLLN